MIDERQGTLVKGVVSCGGSVAFGSCSFMQMEGKGRVCIVF